MALFMGKRRHLRTLNDICPCGGCDYAGKSLLFDACCGRFIRCNQVAASAEQLMRSRYTAYVLNDFDYIKKTWHPDTCPAEPFEQDAVQWQDLRILSSRETGINHAEVCFVARYKCNGRAGKLQECSHFERQGEQWLYIDGEIS